MDLVTFSHLRWNFVYQRPQHIISRFVNEYRVFYVEEVLFNEQPDGYDMYLSNDRVWVVTPHLQISNTGNTAQRQVQVINNFFTDNAILDYWFWYYSPMYFALTRHFNPQVIVYDCMDELSAFKFAPPDLVDLEKELMQKANIVFTGGQSLYQAKKKLHHNIYCFPSSIDKTHFNKARSIKIDPESQQHIPYPRLGFFGVVDERFDIDLVKELATKKPEWHIIIIGPVVKIDPDTLPKNNNIHYLGMKSYEQLPDYIGNWDIAIMPFAINESTRFISPTKTPEYLAAGRPVIATPVHDVVDPYGKNKLVHIAHNADEFIAAALQELHDPRNQLLRKVDDYLQTMSWDKTWSKMNGIVKNAFKRALVKI